MHFIIDTDVGSKQFNQSLGMQTIIYLPKVSLNGVVLFVHSQIP